MSETSRSQELPADTQNGIKETVEKEPTVESEIGTIAELFEYRADDGTIAARAMAEFEDKTYAVSDLVGERIRAISGNTEAKAWRLKSMRVFTENEDQAADLLSVVDLGDIQVYVSTEPLTNYSFIPDKKIAIVPPLTSAVDIGIMMHEIGHGQQFQDSRFDQITPLQVRGHELSRGNTSPTITEIVQAFEMTLAAVPEAASALTKEALDQLRTLKSTREDLTQRSERLRATADSLEKEKHVELQSFFRSLLEQMVVRDDFKKSVDLEVDAFGSGSVSAEEFEAARDRLMDRLTEAGFSFSSELPTSPPAESGQSFVFGSEETEQPEARLIARADFTDLNDMTHLLESLSRRQIIPSIQETYDPQTETMTFKISLDIIKGMEDRFAEFKTSVPAMVYRGFREKQKSFDGSITATMQRIEEIDLEAIGVAAEEESILENIEWRSIIDLPRKILERDAWARALTGLRKLRDATGADFLRRQLVPKETISSVVAATSCESGIGYMVDGIKDDLAVTVSEVMKAALTSYRASSDKFRQRPKDATGREAEDEIGAMPRA